MVTRAGAGAWGGSARNKELGYPAYKDDPEWQRLDAEYNRIRQERLSPSAEQAAREEYEAYMADVFPEGDAAAAERAELELLADADRDARREAERMGEYEQLEEPIKDGDKTGWNYVSFRDDNIRVDHKWVDGQIRFSRATRVYNPDARVKIVDGRKEPAFINLTTAELRHYLQDKYQGKEVEITSDNTIVLFTGEGLKSALKKRDTHKRTLHVLDELVRDSHYTRYEPNDGQAKHKSVNGQFVYTTALRLSDGVYGVELKLDLPKSDPDKTYFKGQTVKMKIADAVLSAGPRSVEPLPANTSGASAAETIRLGDIVSTPTSISYSRAKSQAENGKTFQLNRVYPCELLVMEFKDSGARLIYDIVKIQKPTLTANGDLDEETLRQLKGWTRTGESATDDDSIPYSGAKSQAENEKTFRLSRPVERRKDLIAVHNMDAEGLAGADKLGGLEKPIQINPPIR